MEGTQKNVAIIPEEYGQEEDLYPVLQECLENFIASGEMELAFPTSLTSNQRKFVHNWSAKRMLKTKSKGKKSSRFVTVRTQLKTHRMPLDENICNLDLKEINLTILSSLLQKYPVTNKERHDLLPATCRHLSGEASVMSSSLCGQLLTGKPQVPILPNNSDISEEAKTLPVWGLKADILSAFNKHQVVLVCGETGSGKTTQIPQMVLEEASRENRPCKILCTQPRRISAISVAERVSSERGEKLGGTVGYQIKLEGRTSAKTLLTFCTTGIVLRALMGRNTTALSGLTHIFIDEVHERDKLMDFLLIAIKEALPTQSHLKVILMSANLDVELYSKYFKNCPIVRVPVVTYPVKQYFLEDILEFTDYRTSRMLQLFERLKYEQKRSIPSETQNNHSQNNEDSNNEFTKSDDEDRCCSPSTALQLDGYLEEALLTGENENFDNILYFIMSEGVSANYQHSINKTTALMVAAGRGRTDIIETLLTLDASVDLKSCNGWTASDWAKSTNQTQVLDILDCNSQLCSTITELDKLSGDEDRRISDEKTLLAKAYTSSCKDDDCDRELIFAVVAKIHSSEAPGGILVFLPGYEDIIAMRDRILTDENVFNSGRDISIYCLHSSMQSADQKRVFHNVAPGMRKIVLATNIAETSVTINDIIYIVDSGLHKEMTYDALTCCSALRTVRISQASVTQRKGRAGRCQPGISYHLISKETYHRMSPHQTPEILRTPLQDLCLQSKFLSLPDIEITDFLSKAPEPPSAVSVQKAVYLLKKMDALDQWEDVTDLGQHLLELSLPPHLGKMVLMSCIFKCLDPILTITAFLAYKDPFILPKNSEDRYKVKMVRKKLGSSMFSDHYLYLAIYQAYDRASNKNYQKKWCAENYISSSTMELITKSRLQILAQLRRNGFLKSSGSTDLRDINTNSDNWPIVKAAILSGEYPRMLKLNRRRQRFYLEGYNQPYLHRSCALVEAFEGDDVCSYRKTTKMICDEVKTDWFVYDNLSSTSSRAVVCKLTPVSPLSVLLFCGPMRLPPDALCKPVAKGERNADDNGSDSDEDISADESCSITIDPFVQFSADKDSSYLLLQLRYKIQSFIQRKLKSHFKAATPADDEIIKVLATMLKKEDEELSLIPSDSGTRTYNCNYSHPRSSRITPNNNKYGPDEAGPSFTSTSWRRDPVARAKPKPEASATVTTTNTITLSASKPIACSESAIQTGTLHHGSKDTPKKDNSGENRNETKYFIIRFPTFRQIEIAQNLGTITFSISTERKLLAVAQKQPVILIFALNRGKQFFGYCKFHGRKTERRHHPEFSNMEHHNQVFKVNFVRSNVFFHQTRHLINSFNENLQVHMCRDGQEVDRAIGEQLVKIFERAIVPSAMGNAYLNDASTPPRRQFMPHGHYSPRPPPPFMPPHNGHGPEFAGPFMRPFRGHGFGGGFRGMHRGFRRGHNLS